MRCAHEVAADLRSAEVDPEQITQAVESLICSAAQAMPSGGTVRIALANAEIATAFRALTPGHYIKFTVADTGEAIPAEELSRIFDPFFATKRTGSGLDLATAHSIVKKHQGYIEAQSRTGQGTTFTVWLPAAEAGKEVPREMPAAAVPSTTIETAPARVLLMDDEESIGWLGSIIKVLLNAVQRPRGERAN